MAKRPGLLANVDMGQGTPAPSTNVVEISTAAEAPKPAPAATTVKTSLYLPPKAHRKLKEIALAQDCKVHDLVVQGIDKVLAENGFPAVHELAK